MASIIRASSASSPGFIRQNWESCRISSRPARSDQIIDQPDQRPRWRRTAMMFPGIVPKMHQPLTFLATIENHDLAMKILAVISILALLTFTGAAVTDQLLTNDQQTAQRGN